MFYNGIILMHIDRCWPVLCSPAHTMCEDVLCSPNPETDFRTVQKFHKCTMYKIQRRGLYHVSTSGINAQMVMYNLS